MRATWDDIPDENEWGEPFFTQDERDQLIAGLYASGA